MHGNVMHIDTNILRAQRSENLRTITGEFLKV